jgi:hypothetical protein
VLILGFAACGHVETAPGLQLTPTEQQGLESAVKYAGFWNPGCDPRHIVVQRVDDTRTLVELSVCGEARRYQSLTPAQWVDVTYATQARPDAGLKSPKLGAD